MNEGMQVQLIECAPNQAQSTLAARYLVVHDSQLAPSNTACLEARCGAAINTDAGPVRHNNNSSSNNNNNSNNIINNNNNKYLSSPPFPWS